MSVGIRCRLMSAGFLAEKLEELADAWARKDYGQASALFADQVIYVDPLRYRLSSRRELLAFFENDDGLPQQTLWRTIVYDPDSRTGAAEYSYTGSHRYHGVVLIRLDEQGLIDRWREYQHIVDQDWHDWWREAVD